MKVYKFRPLGCCMDLERIEQIMTTGKFWCSRFWELNDPMEGIYRLTDKGNPQGVQRMFSQKARHLICSFAGARAVKAPTMWGYYANGFKGIAVMVEVEKSDLEQIKYCCSVGSPAFTSEKEAKKVLCRKLKAWKGEYGWRYFAQDGCNLQSIGRIAGVIIGQRYPKAHTHPDKDNRWKDAEEYKRRVTRVIDIAKAKGIQIKVAAILKNQVKVEDMGTTA